MSKCIECQEPIEEDFPCRCGRCEECCSALLPNMKNDDPATYREDDDEDA